jgi:hypothetical protein
MRYVAPLPRGILRIFFLTKLDTALPTEAYITISSAVRSVGIVRSWTKATELVSVY